MRPAITLLVCLCVGCGPDLGECDQAAAEALAYDRSTGLPAFEGQALVIASCGGGRFCHAASEPEDRFGAPAGLDFDVRLAADDGAVDEGSLRRLAHAQDRLTREASLVYGAVSSGSMPPPDHRPRRDGEPMSPWLSRHYVTIGSAGADAPLPGPRAAAAQEILRNWLACGAPVVERPVPRDDGLAAEVRSARAVDPLEPTWQSIYEDLFVARGCVDYSCHGGGDPDAGFEISADSERARTLLEAGAMASGEACVGEGRLVVPGDPAASLLYRKLAGGGDLCGRQMPIGDFPLRDADLAAVASWIESLR